jgi:hypothetical protein
LQHTNYGEAFLLIRSQSVTPFHQIARRLSFPGCIRIWDVVTRQVSKDAGRTQMATI